MNRVLLVQLGDYASGNIGGNPWTLPGGAVDSNEAIKDACCREVEEEACFVVSPDQLRLAAWASRPYVAKSGQTGEITLIFAAQVAEQHVSPNPPETLGAKWVPFDLAEWLEVPESGNGVHPLQPLRRHWTYWTWFASQRIEADGRTQFLLYTSPDQLRLCPKRVLQ